MSKKVIVVSKTHLDLGFTDYAENIRLKYINEYIPNAVNIAKALNTERKKFVWTTGSWILKEALENMTEKDKNSLTEAIGRGDICAHALPFTTHTELLDSDTLEYGLSVIDIIDSIRGKKTVSAKMTDVPGHTQAIIPYLYRKGIKLLHIGVNGASAIPKVPPCFLWRYKDSEVVVIYSGDYGGEYKSEFIDDILYFDHTLDNRGASDIKKIAKKFESIERKYPQYEVIAGDMDYIAEKLWEVRDKLPIVESEIGDTWIHGVATDPYKVAAFKVLTRLKNKWISENTLIIGSDEYKKICDNLLCIAEHTWGLDVKISLGDYTNYLRKDFDKARKIDIVRYGNIFAKFPYNAWGIAEKLFTKKRRSYSGIEKSWSEQRNYIDKVLQCLNKSHYEEAAAELEKLIPDDCEDTDGVDNLKINVGEWLLELNDKGGIKNLAKKGKYLIENNNNSPIEYTSYCYKDYEYWLRNYTRNYENTQIWAIPDFAKPYLKNADKYYKSGVFYPVLKECNSYKNGIKVVLEFAGDLSNNLGAPELFCINYTITDELKISCAWLGKQANRLPESIALRLYPKAETKEIKYIKIGNEIDPLSVVRNGNRKLSAVEKININTNEVCGSIVNEHSPLICLGHCNILKFDNKIGECREEGLSYILYNNIWGTNFPLWYEENAIFYFRIILTNSDY